MRYTDDITDKYYVMFRGFNYEAGSFLFLAILIACLAAAEGAARLLGLVDFPIYDANNIVGYVPHPNQSGSFLNKNDWSVNDRGMGIEKTWVDGSADVLLVGDSIVWGGNPYAEHDRLGPRLQAELSIANYGKQVWPISAGSWAIINEVNWLDANKDVEAAAETIVFVLNSGDFAAASSWANPLTHPREHPIFALSYLAEKYLIDTAEKSTPESLRVPDRDPVRALASVVNTCTCEVHIWLYPTKAELLAQDPILEEGFSPFAEAMRGNFELHLVADIPGWNSGLYKDEIHPTPEGMKALAKGIAMALNSH